MDGIRPRRLLARLREFRAAVEMSGERVGWGRTLALVGRGAIAAWRDRDVVTSTVRRRRYRKCLGCPLFDREGKRCADCGCYTPFKVAVDQDCPARVRGLPAPWDGWGAERGEAGEAH